MPVEQARWYQPSTFASRRSQVPAPQGRRLVSLGKGDWPRRLPNGDVQVIEVELFANADRMTERFVQIPGQALAALQDDSEPAERVTTLPPISGRRWNQPSPNMNPSRQPDPPPRPV